MIERTLDIVFLGLSITSSWGNGHATTYRGLVRELAQRGHRVLFLERDVPWYADNRDLPESPSGTARLYRSLEELRQTYAKAIRDADLVVVGSYAPEGKAVGDWVLQTARGLTAFYDIDTPVTLSALRAGVCEYLSPEQIPRYGMYLSFSGGKALGILENNYRSPAARPLYCSVDSSEYYPETLECRYDLGYMGTYSPDRQPPLEALLLDPAREWRKGRFAVAGPLYPDISWPPNVERIEHISPAGHREFYNRQRFTLNITRADMIRLGMSPSVRLFEASACGIPVISDYWEGLENFFEPGEEILVSGCAGDTLRYIRDLPEEKCKRISARARARTLKSHTAAHRAEQLEHYAYEAMGIIEGPVRTEI